MAAYINSIVVLLLFSVAALLPLIASGQGGFTVDLIHRDSPQSPLYDPTSTLRLASLRAAAARSRERAIYFGRAMRNATLAASDNFYSTVSPNDFEYLMSFYLGTPPTEVLAIADTGSDLIWVQCKPCDQCYTQTAPLFDPQASSTYKVVSCSAQTCSALPQSSCASGSQCEYNYGYGDGSLVDGFLSSETVGFHSTSGRPVQIPSTVFGCTHQSKGTFNKNGAGLVGLGGGQLSLVRQLGSVISNRFSYCLPSDQSSTTSKLNFGSNAVVTGSDAVTTPLISGSPDTFYYLNLEKISVGGQGSVALNPAALANGQGNIIIDSGTTLTILDDNTLQSVSKKVATSVGLPQVSDPNKVFDLCFDVSGAGGNAKFPDITFHFSGDASVVLQQSNAFVESAKNTVCLAFVSNKGNGVSIFGNIAQQNFHIGYDLGAMQLTFAPTDCSNH
ncbi:hypothetical protein HPP92_025450 [Vanilla planifolia]|uniref:Peptidase A1 domain-containing protein n=1 Tax=Vanilla planifolia TaxID=51239 RepID=A0A835UB21_VANPL|nr:hypothetical protein HPP92_025450 [Vanilla planifolia]